ncbi:MAG: prolyl oligopeptidase family serine peptidase [Planctomycetes bacterium]|nr:prolyl oligopeptidase family serine peptidase [Planctomycetota bacterium]
MLDDGSSIVSFSGGRYRVWPAHDPAAPRGRWAVLLHGRGGGMQDCHLTLPELFPLRDLFRERGVTVVAPDYGSDCWMNPAAEAFVLGVMAHVAATRPVGAARAGLMGVSMGGGGALTLAAHHPERFDRVCAVMPVTDYARFYEERPDYRASLGAAYGGSPGEKGSLYRDRSAVSHVGVLSRLPVLLIHGATDALVTPDYSRRLHELLMPGGNVELIEIPDRGHENGIFVGLEERVVGWLQGEGS